jgi:hypothetical protein
VIISHEHRFIFVKTRKTAGTSIELYLERLAGADAVVTRIQPEEPGHTPRNWQRFYNPLPEARLDLLGSGFGGVHRGWRPFLGDLRRRRAFRSHMPAELIRARVGKRTWDEYFTFCFERDPCSKSISMYRWMTRDRPSPPSFEEWALTRALPTDWSKYTIDGRVAVDFVGRFEDLEGDLARALAHVGLDGAIELPRAKVVRSKNDQPVEVTPVVEARIAEVFANEIRTFGYSSRPTAG